MPGIWWKIVQDHKCERDVLRADRDPRAEEARFRPFLRKYDLGSLKHLFLAGEPLDEPTHRWIADGASEARVSTTTGRPRHGWAVLSAVPGVEKHADQVRQPEFSRLPATTSSCCASRTLRKRGTDEKAGRCDRAAFAAGLHDDHLGRRRALREDLFRHVPEQAGVLDFSTGASGTRTATTSFSAAPTTSSTSRGTASRQPARSRKQSTCTRTSRNAPWWAWPIP